MRPLDSSKGQLKSKSLGMGRGGIGNCFALICMWLKKFQGVLDDFTFEII